MLQRIFHVNIVVEDLDRTLAFYCDVLGFSVVYGEVTTDDPIIARGFGYEGNGRMRWALIRLGDDEDALLIDVEQWIEPATTGRPYPECSNNGIGRIALKVGDIDKAYGDLKDKGVAFLSPPQTLHFPDFGDFKFCCFRDPDGIVLELVEV